MLNEQCEAFAKHRDVLVTIGSLLADCIDASPVFYGHRPGRRHRLTAGLRRIIRYNDHGVQTIIVQLELLTSCDQFDSAEFNWTLPKCSSAQDSKEFDWRLLTILRTLHHSLRTLQLAIKPLLQVCSGFTTTHSPADAVFYSHPWSSPVVGALLLAIAATVGVLLLGIVVYVCVRRQRHTTDEAAASEESGRERRQQSDDESASISGAGRLARLLTMFLAFDMCVEIKLNIFELGR
jgi:hypothetical protein